MLRRELEPVLPALASRVASEGWLVFSGLLDEEVDAWARRADGVGLVLESVLRERDTSGVVWAGVLMRPRGVSRGSGGTGSAAPSR